MSQGNRKLTQFGEMVELLLDYPCLYELMLYVEHRTTVPPFGRRYGERPHPAFTQQMYAGVCELELRGLVTPWVNAPFRMIGLNSYLLTQQGQRAINYVRNFLSLVDARILGVLKSNS